MGSFRYPPFHLGLGLTKPVHPSPFLKSVWELPLVPKQVATWGLSALAANLAPARSGRVGGFSDGA